MSDVAPPITLTVNGQVRQLHVSADTTALMALRHDLDLKGTRIGCTEGHCGACTALLDGKPVQTCNLPLWSIAGRCLTTIEALSASGHYSAVQQAFLAEHAGQCGYCVNGIIMTVTAMLATTPPATRAAIIATLDERHLCRCGAHPRILRAIDRAIAAQGAAR